MRKTTKKKLAPVLIAVVAAVFLGGFFFLPLIIALSAYAETGFAAEFFIPFSMICYALIGVSIIVGVLLALRQRLREIDGGEEEDAKQY